jgi:hypothetical protein
MRQQPSYPRQFLPDRPQQQRQSRGDDREQVVRARQAAEALFTPKHPKFGPFLSVSLPTTIEPSTAEFSAI